MATSSLFRILKFAKKPKPAVHPPGDGPHRNAVVFRQNRGLPANRKWRLPFKRVPGPSSAQVLRKDRKLEFPLRYRHTRQARSVYEAGGAPITGKIASPNVHRLGFSRIAPKDGQTGGGTSHLSLTKIPCSLRRMSFPSTGPQCNFGRFLADLCSTPIWWRRARFSNPRAARERNIEDRGARIVVRAMSIGENYYERNIKPHSLRHFEIFARHKTF